eukprot:TRINITY_DN43449_c0_g1_i1.p1 TRINITY_DN43449_c0_g1~~TRINITY_DN43449_c0_g1_i1.p1  ORF type:complete len:502 (+),score=180.00 TRINITY_DN43449_c0_g1_i1:74-1507(+)
MLRDAAAALSAAAAYLTSRGGGDIGAQDAGAPGGGGGQQLPQSCQYGHQGIDVTPQCAAAVIAAALADDSAAAAAEKPASFDAAALLAEARKLAAPRPPLVHPDTESLHYARDRYLTLVQHAPMDLKLRRELGDTVYSKLYDASKRGSLPYNLTAAYLGKMDAAAARGEVVVSGRRCAVRQLRKAPPIYAVDDFLTPEECEQAKARFHERTELFSAPPRICFQSDNTEYIEHPGLREHLSRPSEKSSRHCLSQAASAALDKVTRPTYSYSAHSGPDNGGLRDMLSGRIQAVSGLRERHAFKLQFLSYAANSSYGEHQDCTEGPLRSVNRAATVLVYLSDKENDALVGGETVFPRAAGGPLSIEPKRGTAVFFYSFDGETCSRRSNHLAETVRQGTKLVLQRWYSYAEDAFNSEWATAPTLADHLPFQPYVSCDMVGSTGRRAKKKKKQQQGGGDARFILSCRWFDHPSFEFAVAPKE